MKSIEDWTRELAEANNKTSAQATLETTWELLEYAGQVEIDVLGRARAPCVVCGESTEIYCEPHEFDASYHYCGGSPRCCP